MAKIINPVTFSDAYQLDPVQLDKIGILDPILNADTKLFIDPYLLASSIHPEIRDEGRKAYEDHFGKVIKLLKASRKTDDPAWKGAKHMLEFPEIKWTCLGYGSQSIAGSGSGSFLTRKVLFTAKQIVDIGVEDPDLFVAMSVFEEGMGPDRISDMTANVIMEALISFNERVVSDLEIAPRDVEIKLRSGQEYNARVAVNPLDGNEPVLLIPKDILRKLPLAKDWSEISDVVSKNRSIRNRVNKQIGKIWEVKTRRNKSLIRQRVLESKENFEALLELLKSTPPVAYDFDDDPKGEIFWRRILNKVADLEPLSIQLEKGSIEEVSAVVEKIIDQFKFLVEERRFSEELYTSGSPRHEHAAQRLFFAIAYSYCRANDLDLTPEADTGNGPVDFKISSGFKGRVLVEIKLSTNPKVVEGYTKQLSKYRMAEETDKGYYVIIDVGRMGKKDKRLIEQAKANPKIVFIDGLRKPSASKL